MKNKITAVPHEGVFKALAKTKGLITMFGPCSAESFTQVMETAQAIKKHVPYTLFRAGVWKPRTRPGAFEGMGEQALEWLIEVKNTTGFAVATEVANPKHVEACLNAGIDVVWIGARTTVNPFQVQEIAEALKGTQQAVMVKNPINPDVGLWLGAIERLEKVGITDLAAIHRGFQSAGSSQYRYPPHWHVAIDFKAQRKDIPIVTDCSHISGIPSLIPVVAQKAIDLAMDGIMIETHISPKEALSDARQQISPDELNEVLQHLQYRISDVANDDFNANLETIRALIDDVDDQIIRFILKRTQLVHEIGQFKLDNNITILQIERWKEIFKKQTEFARQNNLNESFTEKLYKLIHEESIRIQTEVFKNSENKSK